MIIELNFYVANLVFAVRKPFDVLAEGLDSKDIRGDWI